MKGLQTGIPLAVLAAVANAQMFVGGNHGDDNGNGASLSFDQTHNTGINNAASNSEKASVNKLAGGKFGPFRRHIPGGYVGGNSGDDNGNVIGNSAKQGDNTKVGNKADNDQDASFNHFDDFDDFLRKRQADVVGGNRGDDNGNSASLGGDQSVNTEINNNWSNEEEKNINKVHKVGVYPPHRKRHGPGFMGVGGNHGDDNGNGIDMSMDQALNTDINNDWSNKQSAKANGLTDFEPFWKRGHVGGNDGDDNGNAVDLDNDQSQNTQVDNEWKNHEDVSKNIVDKGKHGCHHCHKKRSGPGFMGVGGNHGDDRGNDADLSFDQTQNTGVNNAAKNKQDLSVNKLGEYEGHVPFLPVKRHIHPDPFHGVIPEGPAYVVGGNSGDDDGNALGYSGDQTDNHEINNGWSNDQKASANAAGDFSPFKRAYRPTSPEESGEDTVSHGVNSQEAACATETREVVQTVTETVYSQPSTAASQPSNPIGMAPMATPTPTSSVAHVPLTTVVESSTYHMIPVFVPEASSSAAVPSSSHVAASSSASVPTSVDAFRPGAASSQATPSPSSHAGVVFDGAAGHVTPHAGLVSIFCGVMALLAFVY